MAYGTGTGVNGSRFSAGVCRRTFGEGGEDAATIDIDGVLAGRLMGGRCLGSCVAQNYYRAGSAWAPFWFCDDAEKAGLFPDSRLKPEQITRQRMVS